MGARPPGGRSARAAYDPVVTFPGSSGGNPFEQILGDLMKVMGGAATGSGRVELARTFAQQLAAGTGTEANVDPAERIAFEQLAHVAELHVTEITGLTVTPSGAPVEVTAVSPGLWAWHTVDDWRFLLEAMSSPGSPDEKSGPARPSSEGAEDGGSSRAEGPSPGTPAEPGLGLADLGPDLPAATGGSPEMLARMMATFGPMIAAMQLGSAVGHLARSTLGPFELPIPRPQPRLLIVPANVTRFADAWSLAPDEVRLWVCLREETLQAVLARPPVANRLSELLLAVVHGASAEADEVLKRIGGTFEGSDPASLQRLFTDDPTELFDLQPSPDRERAVADLAAVTAAVLGYVEHVLDTAADRLLGGRRAIREAWRRRQMSREVADRMIEEMLGLDLGPVQIDRGVHFVEGVLERAGEDGLARLWSQDDALPTPTEVDAPGLWLERIDLGRSSG